MKVKTLKTFKDLKDKKIRHKGEVFEVTKKRFVEINSTKHGAIVKELKTKGAKGDDKQ